MNAFIPNEKGPHTADSAMLGMNTAED